jgi:hypothetical protein
VDETTIGGTDSLGDGALGAVWALTIVHHRDPDRLGARCAVVQPTLLGRAGVELGDGVWDDGRVSRRHAEVRPAGDGLEIEDLGSRNGTYVNGTRIDQAALTAGDVVGLGTVLLLCHQVPASQGEAGAGAAGVAGAAIERAIGAVAGRATSVLIRGESGTGRDWVAGRLHARSGRGGPLVSAHCGALSVGDPRQALLADGGLVDRARGGTLYLDGIEDAGRDLQLLLLDYLDRAGDGAVRLVASAREILSDRVASGAVRGDFVGRVGRFVIDLPPLRRRVDEIPQLVAGFVDRYAGTSLALAPSLALRLLRYRWPGNIRELESIVERAVIEAGDADRIPLSPALDELLRNDGSSASGGDTPYELSSRERPPAELRVAADGSWFEIAGGERVDLENRRALPLLLAALVDQRASGGSLSVPELVDRGWPGEKVIEEAGANRVYVALTTLRKLGLRDFLVRNRDGYCLDPDVRIDVV